MEVSQGELSRMLGRHNSEGILEGRGIEKKRIKSIIQKLIEENKKFQDTNYKKGRQDILEKLLSEIK